VVQVDGKATKLGKFLTRIEHSKTVLYRRIQCNSFHVSYRPETNGEKEMELYTPQDEQAELIDAWV
jgi:hypothetical protein